MRFKYLLMLPIAFFNLFSYFQSYHHRILCHWILLCTYCMYLLNLSWRLFMYPQTTKGRKVKKRRHLFFVVRFFFCILFFKLEASSFCFSSEKNQRKKKKIDEIFGSIWKRCCSLLFSPHPPCIELLYRKRTNFLLSFTARYITHSTQKRTWNNL